MKDKPGSACYAIAIVSLAIGLFILAIIGCGGVVLWILNGVNSSNPANFHIWGPRAEAVMLRAACASAFFLAVSGISGAFGYLIEKSVK